MVFSPSRAVIVCRSLMNSYSSPILFGIDFEENKNVRMGTALLQLNYGLEHITIGCI